MNPSISHPRIIPAYAGSTPTRSPRRSSGKDHPRIRGEHLLFSAASRPSRGSSPHTRGAPVDVGPDWRRCRIIPAYAGSTGLCDLGPKAQPDHPRIRGEHAGAHAYTPSRLGSSPHTRGAHGFGTALKQSVGIIPAYAGSTSRRSTRSASTWDHPRIRGEHGVDILGRRVAKGIIPAYAGSTRSHDAFHILEADHPRIRGEHAH